MQKPAYAGLRRLLEEAGFFGQKGSRLRRLSRLPSVAPKEAGFFGQKPAPFWPEKPAFWPKEPALARKRAGLRRLSRLLPWRPKVEPAPAGSAGFFWPGKEPAYTGFCRLLLAGFWPALAGSFRGAQRISPAKSTSPPRVDKRRGSAPERCCSWELSYAARGFCGKHSCGAQRKTMSRRKPAFPVFSWVLRAGFCRLWQNRLLLAKRGP